MSYGPQSSDPWSWDLGDESFNNGGVNHHGTTNKVPFGNTGGGWMPVTSQASAAPLHPNGMAPQVSRPHQHQQPPQQHYNDPNAFAMGKSGPNGADFFDSLVTNDANSWGQQGHAWAPQPPSLKHVPSDNQIEAENNEIIPPEIEYSRASLTTGYSSFHPEKNANISSGEHNINTSIQCPPKASQSRPTTHGISESIEHQEGMQNWENWSEDPPSQSPPPPLTSVRRAPEGPLNYDKPVGQNKMHHNQSFLPPPLNSSDSSNFVNNALPHGHNESSKDPVPSKPHGQSITSDSPSNRINYQAPPRSSETVNPSFIQEISSNSQLQQSSGFGSSDPWNGKNVNQHYRQQHIPPSTLADNVSAISHQKTIPPSSEDTPGSAFLNQALPPPLDPSFNQRNQQFSERAVPKLNSKSLFNTPDSRNNNPFLTPSMGLADESLSLHPLGSSTPTGMPYKPENEEVPPKQETLQQQMTQLTLDDSLTPHQETNKLDPTNLEAPPDKEQPGGGLLVADRNQYLETGHLSALKDVEDSSLQDLADESDAPPPGLDRMVTGQLREPIATPSDVDIQSMNSNAPTVGSCALGDSSASSVGSEGDGRQGGSVEGIEDEQENQRLVQGESNAEEQSYLPGPAGHREVPGEAEPMRGRVVLGQMGRGSTPPLTQDQPSPRNDREREIVGRMVVGERTEPSQSNAPDDYRQQHRPRHRHPRGESSFDEEERDYSSDRDRRERDRGDYKRDDRPRRRRDERHRSPEFRDRSDEEYEEKRPYPRGTRERDRRDRRDRDFSPDHDYYYRDYYHDPRDRRPRRFERDRDYHHRDRDYEDDYYYRDHRSRPSSRTGSDYRRLNVSNDYSARSRHYYPDSSMLMNSTLNSSGFPDYSKLDPRAYSEYLETMRRVDPAGYAVWYNNYMANRYAMHQSGSFNNDRASVHSGQSSSNQRQTIQSASFRAKNAKAQFMYMSSPVLLDGFVEHLRQRPVLLKKPQAVHPDPTAAVEEDKEEDYTPRLYTTAHVTGRIDNYGRLLVVDPHYPMDGQKASISLYQLNSLPLPDADMEEFLDTPGPFIPGITHRSTVLSYLKRMSQASQKNSEKLLYDLIHLIVKGNGEINGCDISELLMNSFKKCCYDEERRDGAGDGAISQNEIVSRFRELLIVGNKLEALEWAIEKGSWGHALFLSSKMDPRTHKDVMFRFMDSISQNDPIRTLYQMMSGHIPHASECCGDKQWSDWRPHLAMILGNPTTNSKIDRKSIIRLGDSLSSKGRTFAAHFCYITAQVEVTAYKPTAKLVLLGYNSKLDNPLLASCRSIMLTLCYEYGIKLKQQDFSIPSLQLYKLILTSRLIDIGRNKIALQYCQLMALEALQCGNYDRHIMSQVVDLASRLKMLEPSLALSGDVNAEPEWLERLSAHYYSLPDDYEGKVGLRPSASSSTISEVGQDVPVESIPPILEARNMTSTTSQPLYDPYVAYNQELTINSDSQPKTYLPPQPQLVNEEQDFNTGYVMNPPSVPNTYMEPPSVISSISSGYTQEPSYWDNGNARMPGLDNNVMTNNTYELTSNPEAPSTPVKNKNNDFFKATEEQLKLGEVSNDSSRQSESQKNQQQQQSGKADDQKSGWFGGFLDKLSIRPKNQMKLPDDKNPSIVWDKEKKKWVNLDGDSEATNQVKPPPKAFEMGGAVHQPSPAPQSMQSAGNNGGPMFGGGPQFQSSGPTSLPPANNNKYKLQKGKLMKKNYVDIMSSKKEGQNQPASLDGYMPLMPPVPQQPTFFTPSRVEGLDNAPYDFITPSSNPQLPASSTEEAATTQPQLSRCSSVSSLSREVQFYMDPQGVRGNKFNAAAAQPPTMYNRSQMQ